ncbi:MAG: branched-chain amino acid transaminase [Candidatus Woesearchaeota archaeon]
MVTKLEKIWLDGKFVDWDNANVHILTHALHYGTSVFEGIRSYEGKDGKAHIFKLKEHIERLFYSARMLNIKIKYSVDEIIKATEELLEINNIKACYIRPIVFLGDGPMGLTTTESPVRVSIIAWPWGVYLGDDAFEKGIKVTVCPYRRQISELSKAKIGGTYYISVLSKRFAIDNGYDEALMLDTEGNVAEGSGENIFMIKEGIISTPKLGAILPGITRASVIEILKSKGLDVQERTISLDELKNADELFFTGTAAEMTPIVEIDGTKISNGKVGEMTSSLIQDFFKMLKKV